MNMRRQALFLFGVSVLTFSLAHSNLESASVEDGSTLTEAPDEISLVFTEALETRFSIFKIYPLNVDLSTIDAQTGDESESSDDHESEPAEGSEDHSEHGTEQAEDSGGHGENGGHGVLDAAAEAMMAEKLEVRDEAARPSLRVTPGDGRSKQVTLTLSEPLEPGAYVVMWRALSVDGHTREGFLTFVYQPNVAQTAP